MSDEGGSGRGGLGNGRGPRGPVVALGNRGVRGLLSPEGPRRRKMRGFDDDYADIEDYIIRVTHRIWEQRGISRIEDHYGRDIVIHTTDGVVRGSDRVVAESTKTMAAFPDIRLYPDDVIWSGNDEDGFHTSHRIVWVGRNTGHSRYGPPTGRKVVRTGIAHCFVKENKITEEWIARDELSLVRQLGFDAHELARRMAERDAARGVRYLGGGLNSAVEPETPEDWSPGEDGFDIEGFLRRSMYEIWNRRQLDKIDDYYVDNYVCHTTDNRRLYGLEDYNAHVLSLLCAFPDARVSVDHVCWLGNERDGYSTAVRWTLRGTHEGPGVYGEPTGKRVQLLGITHHEVRDSRFVKEWMVFDEFALLKQIYAPDEGGPVPASLQEGWA